jgi:hypothetical protein
VGRPWQCQWVFQSPFRCAQSFGGVASDAGVLGCLSRASAWDIAEPCCFGPIRQALACWSLFQKQRQGSAWATLISHPDNPPHGPTPHAAAARLRYLPGADRFIADGRDGCDAPPRNILSPSVGVARGVQLDEPHPRISKFPPQPWLGRHSAQMQLPCLCPEKLECPALGADKPVD